MYGYVQRFFLFLLPIVRKAAVQVAADEITKLAYPERRPRRDYSTTNRYYHGIETHAPVERHFQPHIPRPRMGDGVVGPNPFTKRPGFHDVLMVAFDIRGNSAKDVHTWLHDQMPAGDTLYGEHDEIHLDSWWVANDERFDGSDTDSAVFVRKGKQAEARALLRQHDLLG